MFTDVTYQDWLATPETERPEKLAEIVSRYKASDFFRAGLEANRYFISDNTAVSQKVLMKPHVVKITDPDTHAVSKSTQLQQITGNRIRSNFLFRFIVQQNQYLLSHGVTLQDAALKKRLGPGFDKTLEQMGEKALLHGCCYAFWNFDHIEPLEAVKDGNSGFVALLDEMTGAPGIGVHFWQLNPDRPMYVRLFEPDGMSLYERKGSEMQLREEKRGYKRVVTRDGAGLASEAYENYGALPLVPLYGNPLCASELSPAVKSKIDLYDRILSDFGDNLDRANDVYWVLNNFGGTLSDIAEVLECINALQTVCNVSDGVGGGSTAEAKTLEVPYQARQAALDLLEKALYADYMALDMDAMTGGSLTNVAIEAAMTNLNLKADRYEWQCFAFVQGVLRLLGVETEDIRFKRQQLVNRSEVVKDIYIMRADIDHQTALKINSYFEQDEIPTIIENVNEEALRGGPEV